VPTGPLRQADPLTSEAGPRRGRVWRLVLLAAGALLVLLLLRAVGWRAIAENLTRIDMGRFVFLILLYTVSQVAFAFGWALLVDPPLPAARFPRLFLLYLAGDAANSLAPGGVAGEPIKTRLLGKMTGTGTALASLTLHKHADMLAQWLFVATGVGYAVLRFPMPLAARLAAIGGAAGLGVLLLVLTWALRRGTYGPALRRLARWKFLATRLDRYHRSAERVDDRIRSFLAESLGRYAAAVGLCFLGWCGGMVETFLILRWILPSAGWGTAFAVESLAMALNNMLLFIPGRLGSAEGVRAAVFLSIGLPAAPGVAYALVRRARELTWTVPGLLVLLKEHALGWTSEHASQASNLPEQARP
jgi:uncharacterized protein (TIRG00374 family)